MRDILKRAKNYYYILASRPNKFAKLSPIEISEYYYTSHAVRGIHSLIAGSAGRLNWRVKALRSDIEIPGLTRHADANCGLLMADWLIIGEARMSKEFTRLSPLDTSEAALVVPHPAPPLEAAAGLLRKIVELERAEVEAYFRLGALIGVTPKDTSSGVIPTPGELEKAQKQLDEAYRRAGVGGAFLLPMPMEVIDFQNDLGRYNFPAHRVSVIRELCNLFGIDSSLMNDPENKTYSNKTEAVKQLYTGIIIPAAYQFAAALSHALALAGLAAITIEPAPEGLEPIVEAQHTRIQQIIELVRNNILTAVEAKERLEAEGLI